MGRGRTGARTAAGGVVHHVTLPPPRRGERGLEDGPDEKVVGSYTFHPI